MIARARRRSRRLVKHLSVIGIGAGDPGFLTLEAIDAIQQVDVFLRFDKGASDDEPAALRGLIIDRFATTRAHRVLVIEDPVRNPDLPYADAVERWHDERATLLARALRDDLGPDETAGILVWGDPALYDSTLRLVDAVVTRGTIEFEHRVIPGISSVQVLAARHRIPLNRIGQPVLLTTGRRLADGLPDGIEDAVVMLDGGTAFTGLVGAGYEIFWGAYLGTADEILLAGPLDDVAGEIGRVRAEARERKGWMFDTYLLRRLPG